MASLRIAFLADSCIPFDGTVLESRPLGGTETGVILLASALHELGQRVMIFTAVDNPRLTQPLYVPFRALAHAGPLDVLIAVRRWLTIFVEVEARRRFFWTGDSYDQPAAQGIGDRRVVAKLDGLLSVSEWHRRTMCERSGFPLEKAWVMRNGVNLSLFAGEEQRLPKRMIYSSTPYRGLRHLLTIYPELKKRHPDLELHIFSGYQVYAGAGDLDPRQVRELESLQRGFQRLPGCVWRGNVPQKTLAREFMRSRLLAYPNTFEETSCITALEAQAGGCAIVTSALGALPETVGRAGVVIEGQAGSEQYNRSFIEAADRVLSDDEYFLQLSRAGREQAQACDWRCIAERFLEYLTVVQGLSREPSPAQSRAGTAKP